MPETMMAMVVEGPGQPLQWKEVSAPRPGHGQVLIKVAACGICGHDIVNMKGAFPKTVWPAIMGHEISGTVVETGPGIKTLRAGDRVCATQRVTCGFCRACRAGRDNHCRNGLGFYGTEISGGYGQYVIGTERNLVHLPDSIPFVEGAVLNCGVGTGYKALRRGRMAAGETVVITGSGGGVGIHAVQSARAMGGRVIAVTSSPGKVAAIRAAGADEVVVAGPEGFHEQVKSLTGGNGAQLVIEIVGKLTFGSSLRSLDMGGRMVVVGNVQPGSVDFNPAICILKEIEIIGTGHAAPRDLVDVVELARLGRIKPIVAATFPVQEADAAHKLMESKEPVGRLVLTHSH